MEPRRKRRLLWSLGVHVCVRGCHWDESYPITDNDNTDGCGDADADAAGDGERV